MNNIYLQEKINKLRDIYCRFLAVLKGTKFKNMPYHHTFKEKEIKKVIVVASDNYFRAYKYNSKNYTINTGESIYPNAGLLISKCIYCGKINYCWYENYESLKEEFECK